MLFTAFNILAGGEVDPLSTKKNDKGIFINLKEDANIVNDRCKTLTPISVKQVVSDTLKALRSDYNRVMR